MHKTSIFNNLLRDEVSLSLLASGAMITFDAVKTRLFILLRAENRQVPDHYYRRLQELSFVDINSLHEILYRGLLNLADEYLHLHGPLLHVKQQKQGKWQDLLTTMPPLVVIAVFMQHKFPLVNYSSESIKEYYRKVILPNTKHTALPSPYIPQLDNYAKKEGGLHDLHMHLNGSSETDIVWQDYLKAPEKVYNDLEIAFQQPKVREQFEQESHLLNPQSFHKLLVIAQRIRYVLFDLLYVKQAEKYNEFNQNTLLAEITNIHNNRIIKNNGRHPFQDLVSYSKENHYLLSVECLMYIMIFNSLVLEKNEFIACLFYFYLQILGLSNRLLVQQVHQYGFDQFQKLTLNGLRESSEREYLHAFLQISGNEMNKIRFLEGRFSPKSSQNQNYLLLKSIERGWDNLLQEIKNKYLTEGPTNELLILPKLRLVAHFIKRPDDLAHDSIRHKNLRIDTWDRAKVISLIIQNDSKYQKLIIGADAAANEFDASPEVFAPSFRMLRVRGIRHFTYHAGEDFFHLIGGLRAIFEAISFLGLTIGDRIGHATASGVSPKLWEIRLGKKLFIRQGEWLDDLIFLHYLILTFNIEPLRKHIPYITNEITKLASAIYKSYIPLKALEVAWLARKYCPILLLSSDRNKAMLTSVFDENEWDAIMEFKKLNGASGFWEEVLRLYHSASVRKEYNEIISINVTEILDLEELELLQLEILRFMHSQEVVIETLPTSNVRIGHHSDYHTYHLWNWIRWEDSGKFVPPIVVGTDDTGIFATNILNEYANIYCHLINYGNVSHNKAMTIIERLDKNGRVYKFE